MATVNSDQWKVAMAREVRRHRGHIHPAGFAVASQWLRELFDIDDPLEVSRLSDCIIAKLEQERVWSG